MTLSIVYCSKKYFSRFFFGEQATACVLYFFEFENIILLIESSKKKFSPKNFRYENKNHSHHIASDDDDEKVVEYKNQWQKLLSSTNKILFDEKMLSFSFGCSLTFTEFIAKHNGDVNKLEDIWILRSNQAW